MAQHYVYRFYTELKDYKPKIWRRFEINGEKTVAELGYAIMIMFEMRASHLFCLRENRRDVILANLRIKYTEDEIEKVWKKYSMSDLATNVLYELPREEIYLGDDERLVEANKVTLRQIAGSPGWKLHFEYDYGDSWEVELTLEEGEKRAVPLPNLPLIIGGEGFGIIEDVGGTHGLQELAKILKRGTGKKFDEYCEWLDSTTLDLEAFDIDDMNFRVKKLLRVYRDIYEYHYAPTDRMLKVLLREYQGKGSQGY